MRPWLRSRVRSPTGTLCQGMAAQRSSRVGWLALTTSRSWACLLVTRNPGGLVVGLERVGGDHHAGQVQGRQQWGEDGDLLGRAADAVGPAPLGWCGPSPRAGVPGGRHRLPHGRRATSCRPRQRPAAGWPRDWDAAGRPARRRWRRPARRRPGGKGCGGWWPRPVPPSGRERHGGRPAQPALAGARRRPTRRSRRSTGHRSAPRRRPWPGWRPRGGGDHGQLAGRGRRRGRPAGGWRRCPEAGTGRSGGGGPGQLGSGMMGRQARASIRFMRLWKPHDPGRSRLPFTIRHHVTNKTDSQSDEALAPIVCAACGSAAAGTLGPRGSMRR